MASGRPGGGLEEATARSATRRRSAGPLPLVALLLAAIVVVGYAASLRADVGLVQSGLAQVRTALARLSGGRVFDAEEVGADEVEQAEQGDGGVSQLLADPSVPPPSPADADGGGGGGGDEAGAEGDGTVDDVNITDLGAVDAADAAGGAPLAVEEDEEGVDETAEPSPTPVRRPAAAPSKWRAPGAAGSAAARARPGGKPSRSRGSGSSAAAAIEKEEDDEDEVQAAADAAAQGDAAAAGGLPPQLPADAAYSWLQPPSAPTQALLDDIRRVAWLRTPPTRPAHGPPCRGVGASTPQAFEVALGYPRAGVDGSGAPPRLQYEPGGRQARCVPVGGSIVMRIRSADKRGRPMCEGGDFYEVQLAHTPDGGGPSRYKARPRTVDHGDGSYSLVLSVPADPALAGTYDVAVTLLFSRYGGLTLWGGWKGDRFYKRPRHWKVRFSAACPAPGGSGGGGSGTRARDRALAAAAGGRGNATARGAAAGARRAAADADGSEGGGGYVSCRDFPFTDYPLWAGHWVNTAAVGGGRCAPPYCTGSAARLGPEAEGWVYRLPRCYFHLFSVPEARACLARTSWVAMFGDSNHQDTGRNIFHYVLDAPVVRKGGALPRTYDVSRGFELGGGGGGKRRGTLRVTNLFTGHYETLGNNLGVRALAHAGLRERHWPLATGNPHTAFTGSGASGGGSSGRLRPPPAALIFNTGLHDALFMPGRKWSPSRYVEFLRDATRFWGPLLDAARAAANATGAPAPVAVWHTTVAPAGVVNRRLPLNPQKVEVMNRLTVGELAGVAAARGQPPWAFVDYYDMSFPWHWDNKYSDGGHYGRPPWHRNKGGKKVGSAHFVDVMYAHVLLNAICRDDGR